MPNREFLETYPLYRKLPLQIHEELNAIPKVPIKMGCGKCGNDQTFLMINEYYERRPYLNYPSKGEIVYLEYNCAGCGEFDRNFLVKISNDGSSVMKVGQFPAWETKGNSTVERILGTHRTYLTRGLICESQGYGIAAFSYYRRIVEEIIDRLLDQIEGLLSGPELETYRVALAKTKTTRVTAEKIDLVKDLLPPVLRPDEMNPLRVLHETLSQGLHAESDEVCLESAEIVREVVVFLATQIESAAVAKKTFTSGMRTLLERKATRSQES